MMERPLLRWRLPVRAMLLFVAANLLWETAQMPLYTLWRNGSPGEIAFAVLHCTVGDGLIAAASFTLAIVLTRGWYWPERGFRRVLVATTLFGLAYTIFSEWLNVEWRGTWAYADAMPLLPIIGTGLSPVLQWLLLPPLSLLAARNMVDRHNPIGVPP
ncbi:MAG: hypothetical protein H7345_11640 [Rubritepida sp.]|nr:hypothetical protein [Rubritepida sp.]